MSNTPKTTTTSNKDNGKLSEINDSDAKPEKGTQTDDSKSNDTDDSVLSKINDDAEESDRKQ